MGRRRALAILLVVVAGCTSSTAHAPAKASPTTATGARISPGPTPSASPTLSADLPLSTVGFSCRLPVITFTTGGDGVTYQGGFVSFPSARYTEDLQGTIFNPYPQPFLATKQAPVLRGVVNTSSPFYDAAAQRWVPAAAATTAPDGASYAYADSGATSSDATIHVVNVALGTEKTFKVAVPSVGAEVGIEVADYDGSGVYFLVDRLESYPAGVWRLDVGTGRISALARVDNVMAVRNGSAWAGFVDPHDPNPPKVPASRQLFDTLLQVNLGTGAQTNWYYTLGRAQVLMGFASGDRPLVSVSDAPDFNPFGVEVRLIDQPGTGGEDNGELVSSGGIGLINPQADGDREWFGSDRGLYLYTQAGGLQKVFAFDPDPKTARTMSPAGFCR